MFEINSERARVSVSPDLYDANTLHIEAIHAEEMRYVSAPLTRDEVRQLRDELTRWLGDTIALPATENEPREIKPSSRAV